MYVDRRSHESKQFGFVSYSSAEEAQHAIHVLNGLQIKGGQLHVQIKD